MSLADEISNWMRAQVEAAGLDGITLGLSGGVDSACVAGLAQRAVGRGAVITALPPAGSRLAQANLKPRLRMTTLYYVANTHNYLVAGTSNKSELMVGYFVDQPTLEKVRKMMVASAHKRTFPPAFKRGTKQRQYVGS